MTPTLSILLRHFLAKGSLLLVISGTLAGFTRAGCGQEPNVLLPPRVGLSTVDFPDLANVESGVREQISAVQKQLVENAGSPSIPSSKLSQLYGLMGQVYHAYSLVRPAEQCYLNANRLAPGDFTWLYLLGYLYQQAGRMQEAILYYSEVRRIRPDYLAAAVNLGTVYLDQNRPEEARNAFGAALSIDSSSAAAHYGLGQAAMSARDYPEAVRQLEAVLSQVPQANRVHYVLAMAYRGMGDLEKAADHFKQAGSVGVRPADPLADGLKELVQGERMHLVQGRMAFNAGRYAEAAEAFKKAAAANPASTAAQLNLASALGQAGDIPAAASLYREIIKTHPQNETAHYNLGILMARSGEHAEAITHLQASLGANPQNAEAELLLAREMLAAGRHEEAGMHVERVLSYDPDNEDALLSSVEWLMKKNAYDKAMDRLTRANARFADRGRTAHMLAYLLAACPQVELRNGAKAVDLATRVYAATRSMEHGATLALAMAESGRCKEAQVLQARLIEQAEAAKQSELAARLRAGMELYSRQNCRPPGGADTRAAPGKP